MLSVSRRLLLPVLLANTFLCLTVPPLFKQPYVDPPAWSDFGFAACDLPCWAGITPGETSFGDAFELLVAQVPALSTRVLVGNIQINFSASSPEQVVNGLIFEQQRLVGSIQLNLEIPFVQLVTHLGAPQCFVHHTDAPGAADRLTVYWETGDTLVSALVLSRNGHVPLSSPVQALAINADETMCGQEETLPWVGSASSRHYTTGELDG